MLYACSYTICLVFRYTSWHFYAFSRTNLLTRCHSASSLFFAIFMFQKSYTGNILEIGRNKSRTSRNLPKLPEVRRGDREGPRAGHTVGRRGQPLACAPATRVMAPGNTLDGAELTWKQCVLVRGDDQPVGNPKRKV
jgi:hypothetical protein